MDKKQIIEDYLQGRHPMEQQSWELPSAQELDNAEAEFEQVKKSLTLRSLQKKRGLKFWLFAAAACLVGFVVIFLAPPKSTEEQLPLALEEPMVSEQLPVVAEETSQPQEQAAKPQQPYDSHKTHKSYENYKPQQPAEVQQGESPLTNHLLAEAQSVPLPESDGQREELDPEASILPPDRQALVDIYLAEEALQVAYMQQEQTQELRAFTARLQGKEPETSHLITAF
ncbi:MAG: hypothetical protein IKO73_00720 [Bacteroidaceae bacterium]|nr:hypothetical protein [Bacteroidaceae bacterium]